MARRRQRSEVHSVYAVFTPTSQARVNFVSRGTVNDALVAALRTPGKQVIVYGESGSGKSTLLQRKLEELYTAHITSRCSASTTVAALLLDAFDKVSPYYLGEAELAHERKVSRGLIADVGRIRASVDSESSTAERRRLRRALPPQLTAQRLGELLGALEFCWVLEDFHKVAEDQRTELAQSLKTFSDLAAEYPLFKTIAIGATDSARLVVSYEPEMTNRVSEILVPLMTDGELRAVVDQGQSLMNVDMTALREHFVRYSVGVASVCHQLALNACLNNEILTTAEHAWILPHSDLQPALQRWVAESSDTLKARFDLALRRHRVREYDNCRLILKSLAEGPFEGLLHSEILRSIREAHPKYPAGNLTRYLHELGGDGRGNILMAGVDGRFRFIDPLHHTFAQAVLLPPAEPAERSELYLFLSEFVDSWSSPGSDSGVDMYLAGSPVEVKGRTRSRPVPRGANERDD